MGVSIPFTDRFDQDSVLPPSTAADACDAMRDFALAITGDALAGRSYDIEIDPSQGVAGARVKIASVTGIPPAEQELWFGTAILLYAALSASCAIAPCLSAA